MDDLIRIGGAAAALGVSVDTLRRWEREGRVEFVRRGNQRFMSLNTNVSCSAVASMWL